MSIGHVLKGKKMANGCNTTRKLNENLDVSHHNSNVSQAKSTDESKDDGVLTEEQIQEYREAFRVFDKNADGTISCSELQLVLVSLGKDHTDEEVQEMIDSVDMDKNGSIEFDEFVKLMEKETRSFESEEMIRQAFEMFDTEGDGYITLKKLKQVIQELGCKFTEEEIDDMMELADDDGDGRVEYEDYVNILQSTPN